MIDWDRLVLAPLDGVFGEPISYKPAAGWTTEATIRGIFDSAYLKDVMFDDGSTGVTEVHAVLGVRLCEFIFPPAQNDHLLVPRTGAYYVVKDVRPDGHGSAKLILSKASQW